MAGLYDTGFNGQLGGSLRVWNPVTIEWGAKLAQILFHTSKFRGSYYAGSYQGTDSPTAITS